MIVGMSLRDVRRHVGQLAIVGFAGTRFLPICAMLAREFDLGGVIFFARNVDAPEQVADLSREAQELADELPLWVSVDQEGGRVARLKSPFTEVAADDDARPERRRAAGRALRAGAGGRAPGGRASRSTTRPCSTSTPTRTTPSSAIGRWRSAPRTSRGSAARSSRTLQGEGIAACGKHFPGHGDTSTDSHLELPLVEHPPDRLDAVELVPFKAAIEAGVASIMTAHILIPALDEERPATLSPRIVDGLLKKKLGFDGLVVTDDLEMKAISAKYGTAEATVEAIAAGCDAVLMCGTSQEAQMAALEAVIHAVEDGTLPLKRVEDALARHRRVKERFLAPPRPLPLTGAALRAPARARRAPGRRRRDGEVRVGACASRVRSGQGIASPSSRPPAGGARASSTPASPSCGARLRTGLRRARLRAQRLPRRPGGDADGRVPARLERSGRSPRWSRSAAAIGSVHLLPLLDPAIFAARPRRSSATATTPRPARG